MGAPAKKGFLNNLTAPLRIQSLWKKVGGVKGKDPAAGIEACNDLLSLLGNDTKAPDKGEVYTARAECYYSLHQYDKTVEDRGQAVTFYRQKKAWREAELSEKWLRTSVSLRKFAALEPGSPKARLWLNLMSSNIYDKSFTEEKMGQLLEYLGDPDRDIRFRANELVASLPFEYNRRLVDWLISFYRDHLEGSDRYTGLRALRQIGRLMHMTPTDSIPLEISLLKYGVASAFANCACAFCGWLNLGIPVPPNGLEAPYYSQKNDQGVYAVPAICDSCANEFYLVWDRELA